MIALLAVHYLRSVESVGGFKFIKARFGAMKMGSGIFINNLLFAISHFPHTLAFPVPQFHGIFLAKTLVMPAIRTQYRKS